MAECSVVGSYDSTYQSKSSGSGRYKHHYVPLTEEDKEQRARLCLCESTQTAQLAYLDVCIVPPCFDRLQASRKRQVLPSPLRGIGSVEESSCLKAR